MSLVEKRIAKIIRWAATESKADDVGPYQTQRVNYLRRGAGRSASIYPYGFSAAAPAGILSAMLSISGKTDARAHMPISGPERIRLKSGEVVVFHPSTGAKAHFKEDGSIDIESPLDVSVVAGRNATVVAATLASITAPAITLEGDVTVTGTLDAAGTITAGGDLVDQNSIELSAHVHQDGFHPTTDNGPPKDP